MPDKMYKVTQWQQVTYLVRAENQKTETLNQALNDPSKCIARIGHGEFYTGNKIVEVSVADHDDLQEAETTRPGLRVHLEG